MSVDPFGANVGDQEIIDAILAAQECQLIRSAPTSVTTTENKHLDKAKVSVDPFGANVGDHTADLDLNILTKVSVDPFGANVGDRYSDQHACASR